MKLLLLILLNYMFVNIQTIDNTSVAVECVSLVVYIREIEMNTKCKHQRIMNNMPVLINIHESNVTIE